jgi:hypothetical protein
MAAQWSLFTKTNPYTEMKTDEKKIEDLEPEQWAEIIGTNGLYLISNHGRVKRLEKMVHRSNYKPHKSKEIIRKLTFSGRGYLSLCIKVNNKIKRLLVHRLVGLYFIPNPEDKPHINHIFGDKTDNYFKHLEWSTVAENINHAFSTGLNKHVKKNDPVRSKSVIQYDINWNRVAEFPSIMEVQRSLGYKYPNISSAISKKKLSHGYYWKFKV